MGEDAMTAPLASASMTELLLQANRSRRCGDYDKALRLYHRLLERCGHDTALLAQIANCHYHLALARPRESDCRYAEAVSWMEKAVASAPEDAHLHARLALYYEYGTLDYERAAEEYRKAIELSPCELRALARGAGLYGVPEEVVTLDEAINWLERAIELDPDNPNLHALLGDRYHERGQPAAAEREWIQALLCPQPLHEKRSLFGSSRGIT